MRENQNVLFYSMGNPELQNGPSDMLGYHVINDKI